MNKKTTTCLAIVGGELFIGVTMLAGYQAWVQPGAPRNRMQTKVEAAAPAATPAPVVAQGATVAPPPMAPAPIAPAPAAAPVAPAIITQAPPPSKPPANSKRATAAVQPAAQRPQTKPVQPQTPRAVLPAVTAPAPVPSPTPRQLTPTPAPEPVTLTQRGIAALNARDFTGAAAVLRQARQAQPANPDIGYLLGMALEGSGEFGAAIDAFRSCKTGPYEQIARSHVKGLAKKLGK